MPCEHNNFQCNCEVARLSHTEGGPIMDYTSTISISCADCGMKFRFIGLPAGSHYTKPTVSVDGIELRAPMEPATHERFLTRSSYTFPVPGKN